MARTCTYSNRAKYFITLKYFNIVLFLILFFLYGYEFLSDSFSSEDARLFFAMILSMVGFGLVIYIIVAAIRSVNFWTSTKIYYDEDLVEFASKHSSEKFFYRQLPIAELILSYQGEPISVVVSGKNKIYRVDHFDNAKALVELIKQKSTGLANKISTGILNWTQITYLLIFQVLLLILLFRLEVLSNQTPLEIFWILLLALGFLFGAGQPISNIFGPKLVIPELLISLVLASPFVIHFTNKTVVKYIIEAEEASLPCGKNHILQKCYRIDQKTCLQIWEASETTCLRKHGGINVDKPGKLVGPVVNKCRESEFDRQLHWLKAESLPECKELTNRIKDYQTRYGDN